MGDDGTIRGIDIVEDQVIVELKDGHQGKIKDFITFIDEDSVEKLITSGIDREIVTWRWKLYNRLEFSVVSRDDSVVVW